MKISRSLSVNALLLVCSVILPIMIGGCDSAVSPDTAIENNINSAHFESIMGNLGSGRSSDKCMNIRGTITGVVDFINGPFFNDIDGDLVGLIGAYYGPDSDIQGNGNWGADLFSMGHYIITADGELWSEDEGVASPVPQSGGTKIRVTNRYNFIAGTGIYEGAYGKMHTHGEIEFLDFIEVAPGVFAPVVLDYKLTYHGRVCADN